MDLTDLRTQIVVALVAIAVLWVLFKALKVIWKLVFIFLVFLALSFALPVFREWIFGLF
ncbi:MAG: photosystem II protein Y [Candidatus Omnitrophica bacterium]|nr:photosystem II protein Y [Candidatus Omnitrophota bacterium]